MTIPITNDAMLLAVVGADMVKVIDDVSEWLLGQIYQSLLTNVYSYPTGSYERLEDNGGLLGAWKKETIEFVGNYISQQVGFDYTMLDYVAENHQHGNLSEDRRESIPRLVEEGAGYDFGGNATMKREFWSIVEQSLEDGSLDGIVENSFRKRGIVFQRI
jgi:hypothetical protein